MGEFRQARRRFTIGPILVRQDINASGKLNSVSNKLSG